MRLPPLVLLGLLVCAGCPDHPPGDDASPDPGTGSDPGTDPATDTDDTASTVSAGVLEQDGSVACPSPDERAKRPFDTWTMPSSDPSLVWLWAGGVVGADFDGNDRQEVFVTDEVEPRLLEWNGERFDDISAGRLPAREWSHTTGGVAGDVDNDGDLDLFVTRYEAPNVLLLNDGNGKFTDASISSGLGAGQRLSVASSMADMDRDGDLDLFVGNYGVVDHDVFDGQNQSDPSELWRNLGDGTFEDASALLPPAVQSGYTYAGGWHDIDHDAFPELYVVNDFGATSPNQLLWNDQGTLVEDGGASGLNVPTTGMGLGVADAAYIRLDDGTYEDRASVYGIADTGATRGFLLTDFNDDGWLDMFMPDIAGPSRVFVSRCGSESWLRVRLRADSHNRFGVGAKIRVKTGSVQQERILRAGGTNFGSASPIEAHFGLASREVVDQVEVIWPDGARSTFRDVPTRQRITIRR